jgi:hypothetical protein
LINETLKYIPSVRLKIVQDKMRKSYKWNHNTIEISETGELIMVKHLEKQFKLDAVQYNICEL